MGSCNYKNQQAIESINVISSPIPNLDRRKLTLASILRKSGEIPPPVDNEIEESSKEEKQEQGDLLINRKIIKVGGSLSIDFQGAFQDKLIKIEGTENQTEILLKSGI